MDDGQLAAVDTLEGLRDSVGSLATIELKCTSIPDGLNPGSVDGVVDVTTEDRALTVKCSDPSVKADVVEYVNGRTDVRNVLSNGTSLEALFNSYTGGGLDAETPENTVETEMST